MAEELITIDHVDVDCKRKKLFPDGEAIIGKVVGAQWVPDKYSPGVAVDFKTVSPDVGYSLRSTVYLSTRKDDGSHYVAPDKPFDYMQRAVLTDEEFFLQDSVSPETWIGRPVAFVVEQASYETEEGEERFYNIIKPHTVRKPTNEELADLQERFKGSKILAAQKQASEAKALAAAPAKNDGNEEVEEGDLEQAPF
jgi:hypothetical protein